MAGRSSHSTFRATVKSAVMTNAGQAKNTRDYVRGCLIVEQRYVQRRLSRYGKSQANESGQKQEGYGQEEKNDKGYGCQDKGNDSEDYT